IPGPSPFLTEDRTSLRLSAQDSTRNGWLTIADELSNLYRASLGSFRISERANVSLKNLLTKRLLSAYLLAILVGPLVIAACSDDDNGTEPARTGACCRTDGTCVILTSPECSSQSWYYIGDNVLC